MNSIRKHLLFAVVALVGHCPLAHAAECDSPRPEWLLCDDFESGSLSKWNVYFPNVISIVAPPTGSSILGTSAPRTGNGVLRIHYEISSPTPEHADDNSMLHTNLSALVNHIFVRGYVLIPNNTTLYGATSTIQRKLLYFKSNPRPGTEEQTFGFFLSSEVSDRNVDYVNLRLGYQGGGGVGASIWDVGRLPKGRWVALQMEARLNTPTAAGQPASQDGVFRVWVDNVLIHETTTVDFRSPDGNSAAYSIGQVEVGRQVDRYRGDAVSEDRYWDNIVISRSFIPSPVGPKAPTGLR